MKRVGELYDQICSFENLLAAAYRARRGKRFRPDVAGFQFNLEHELLVLRDELRAMTYFPGPYHVFSIRDPKPRLISAAPYRDRIVHHAVCRVIEPIFERTFTADSYANRAGKGTHRALDRCTAFCRRYAYVLKCDIRKYFPSMDHEILIELLERKIKCQRTCWLLSEIVRHSNLQEPVTEYFPGDDLWSPYERRLGIPIGNLTSQFFANVYLNGFDHYVKEGLGCDAYIRFADDFLAFDDARDRLFEIRDRMGDHLERLRLRMHPDKCHVTPVRCGVPFLGWQVYADHRRLRRSTGVRIHRRLRALAGDYSSGRITTEDVRASITSTIGHLKHGDTWGLRKKLLGAVRFSAPVQTAKEGRTHG